jgi:hypothetical protein
LSTKSSKKKYSKEENPSSKEFSDKGIQKQKKPISNSKKAKSHKAIR